MASNAISGVGAKFKRMSGTFQEIAEITSISGPNLQRDTIEVTSLGTLTGYKEFIPGFRDSGEVSLEMNFYVHNYTKLKADFESQALGQYQIVLGDTGATTFEFYGLVTAMSMSVPTADKVSSTVTIKVSGSVTVTS